MVEHIFSCFAMKNLFRFLLQIKLSIPKTQTGRRRSAGGFTRLTFRHRTVFVFPHGGLLEWCDPAEYFLVQSSCITGPGRWELVLFEWWRAQPFSVMIRTNQYQKMTVTFFFFRGGGCGLMLEGCLLCCSRKQMRSSYLRWMPVNTKFSIIC